MGKQGPRSAWHGTIRLESLSIAVQAYSAFGDSVAPTLYRVHQTLCSPPPKSIPKATGKKVRASKKDASHARAKPQLVCERCGQELKPDEVSWQVTTPTGKKVLLESADLDAMDFTRSEGAQVRLVSADDSTIAAVGMGRRLYLFPDPGSTQDYWIIFEMLWRHKKIGFIPFIALKKDEAYVAVIRPLILPRQLFDDEEGPMRKVLALDCVGDTNQLKDPKSLPGYPEEMTVTPGMMSRMATTLIQTDAYEVPAEECVNPMTARIQRGVRRAQRRTREKQPS